MLLFWTAITGTFNVLWIGMLSRQLMTWSYAETTGTIEESRIERGRDSDGDTTYDARITYVYDVGGQRHQAHRIRCFAMRFNGGHRQARGEVRRFPQGKRVAVFYDAGDPSQAVVDRSLRGEDFFLPLFMNPFNIIMLGGWYLLIKSRRKNGKPAGFSWRDDGLKVVARLYSITPTAAAATAVMVSSFVLIFVCGFGMMSLPADWLVPGAWLVVISSAVWAWKAFRRPTATLEYDHFSGRLAITKFDGQSHAFMAADIVELGATPPEDDSELTKDANGSAVEPSDAELNADADEDLDECHASTAPGATISYRTAQGQEQIVVLANWTSAESVQWLLAWLRETLRLKA
jgi:hypothetical protein